MLKRMLGGGIATLILASVLGVVPVAIATSCPAGSFPVSGTVTDAVTGLPLDVVTSVGISFADGTPYDGEGTTLPASTFETCLPAGEYIIGFVADGYFPEWYDDSETAENATSITVDGPVSGVDAALTPFPVITGRVTDSRSGLPLFTSVGLTNAATGAGLDGEGTDAAGVYEFVIDPNFYPIPGTYLISFAADSHWAEWYDNAKKRSKAAVITVTRDSGVISGIDADLRPCRRPTPEFCIPRNFNR